MGRFARSQSGALSDRADRQPPVSARPRFSTEPQIGARGAQVKLSPVKTWSSGRPLDALKAGQKAPRLPRLNRRSRKRIRLAVLAVMSLIALSAGWMLGKSVMGPSQVDTPQPAVSMQGAIENKSASNSDLEAKAVDAQGPQSASQDLDARQGGAVQDENVRPNRKASYSGSTRREFTSANARRGPGIGIVTRPIKAVFRPLKKANPFRLRIW